MGRLLQVICPSFVCVFRFFLSIKIAKEGHNLTQEELRNLLRERTEKEKQVYIAKVTGIDKDVLSRFKLGKIDLYPALFKKLEAYLINS